MSEFRTPSQSGTSTAYYIEFKNKHDVWEEVPIYNIPAGGVPHAAFCNGIHQAMGLYGYESAMALAWQYKACNPFSDVRIVPLKMQHSITTERQGEPIELCRRPPEAI